MNVGIISGRFPCTGEDLRAFFRWEWGGSRFPDCSITGCCDNESFINLPIYNLIQLLTNCFLVI